MIKSSSIQVNGQELHVETGRIARQASGAAVVTLGETVVLVTAVSTNEVREGIDFIPLTVEYQEMSYAGGRIPGNFFRRDMGRPSERETLTARLIDRPLRPLFPKNYHFETQVIATVLSSDKENDGDVLAILGASAALEVSDIPFKGPIAGVRVGRVQGRFLVNPTVSQLAQSDVNLIVAGNRTAVVMVEGGGNFLSESEIIDAIFFAHEAMQPMLDMQQEIRSAAGKPKRPAPEAPVDHDLLARIRETAHPLLHEVITTSDKKLRQDRRDNALKAVLDPLVGDDQGKRRFVTEAFYDLERDMVRKMVLEEGRRIDGRPFTQVRPIDCMVGVLPRVHGSALFARGETQAMVLTTLGTEFDEQKIESIYGDDFRSFILHYNFPPYSVGEAKRLGGPGRREIGHGALARRALIPVMPGKDEFNYCTRVVSEILESNGSSSMASVCGASLSLMDAGVPIKDPVAGIAMGLVSDGNRLAVLTDIIGDEDHYGDMDFKVTGTRGGVTAVQMDIKMDGITREVLKQALDQAREARLYILDKMASAISRPRSEVSPYAPVVVTMEIKPEKIKNVIGPGGKTIKRICHESGARVDVDDVGAVTVAGANKEAVNAAVEMIKEIIEEVEVGKLYMGKVVKIMDFGAFVEILPGTDGLIHISQLDKGRVEKVTDVLKEGDKVLVKVLEVDEQGKIRLSRKAALGENPDVVSKDRSG